MVVRVGLTAVLSGGGSKGAFQVGVLDALRKKGVHFDAFIGVSTGAIQALGGAMDRIAELRAEWEAIAGNDDIYRPVLSLEARLDPEPLEKLLRKFVSKGPNPLPKRLRIGVVSLQSTEFRTVDETAPDLAKWVLASCMIPIDFPPIRTKGLDGQITQWIDGGVRSVTPLMEAAGLRPAKVIIVRASPPPDEPYEKDRFGDIISIGLRAVKALRSEVSRTDMANVGLMKDFQKLRDAIIAQAVKGGINEKGKEALVRELSAFGERHFLVPAYVIAPHVNFSPVNEYNRIDIGHAIASGERFVKDHWQEIESFLNL
jgi:NTE family protein